jgi:3-hydroxyacyl-CoA dehydrogenase
MPDIRKVAVLGAGTMGARIAAHLANAQIPCVLLDLPPASLTPEEQSKGLAFQDPKVRNRLAESGLAAALRSSPAAFFVPENARMIAVGNLEDHLGWLKSCDWIIEAIVEDREAKRTIYRTVDAVRAAGSIISSNTSGISIASLAEGFSDDFCQHFLGTHFFNPPRYMKLLEVIPTAKTRPEVIDAVTRFGDGVLGKGVVLAKDTPNFIANRIGTFLTMSALRLLAEGAYTIEEIDALTGPVIGLPKSATLRTLDIVGLDVLVHVVENLAASLPNDERRDLFQIPAFVTAMMERQLLGDKTGQGFYKKVKAKGTGGDGSEILALDLSSFNYRQRQKPKLPSLEMTRGADDVGDRIKALFAARDRAGDFYRKFLGGAFHYAASRIPEISDDIVSVDKAMRWGFNWERGIFELWDTVGVAEIAQGWKQQSWPIPPLVEKLLASGRKTFYSSVEGVTRYFDFAASDDRVLEDPPGVLLLPSLKARNKEIRRNPGASLFDLGDGVVGLEFHSKMNTIGPDTVAMMHAGLKLLAESFDAMVIGNHGANFSVGANLMLVLISIQEGEWDELDEAVRAFQDVNMALKYAPKPVVSAPFGLTLGGGVEITVHSSRARAAAETYLGLVEVGVGVIPAGGGTKEMLVRAMDKAPADEGTSLFDGVQEVFQNIGMAKVSTSAEEARKLGYLSERDSYSMNHDRQIADAKQLSLDLVKLGHRPGKPREDVWVLGQSAFAKMKLGLHLMRRAEHISDYDVVIGTQLAKILSGGGEFTSPQRVSEQFLLDLEREAFLSLCGERKTQDRIQHMLKKGKPLRN